MQMQTIFKPIEYCEEEYLQFIQNNQYSYNDCIYQSICYSNEIFRPKQPNLFRFNEEENINNKLTSANLRKANLIDITTEQKFERIESWLNEKSEHCLYPYPGDSL